MEPSWLPIAGNIIQGIINVVCGWLLFQSKKKENKDSVQLAERKATWEEAKEIREELKFHLEQEKKERQIDILELKGQISLMQTSLDGTRADLQIATNHKEDCERRLSKLEEIERSKMRAMVEHLGEQVNGKV